MLFRALQSGDYDIWNAMYDPRANRAQIANIFRVLHNGYRNSTFVYSIPNPYIITWANDPKHGRVARFWFTARLGKKPVQNYYWQFCLYQGRWYSY
jgi:hypothetical protein